VALPWYWMSCSRPLTSRRGWRQRAVEAHVLGRIENGCAAAELLASSPRITLEVPTNSATKVVAGFMYRLRGVSTCSMRPG
jgi:hypothetical protein